MNCLFLFRFLSFSIFCFYFLQTLNTQTLAYLRTCCTHILSWGWSWGKGCSGRRPESWASRPESWASKPESSAKKPESWARRSEHSAREWECSACERGCLARRPESSARKRESWRRRRRQRQRQRSCESPFCIKLTLGSLS